MNENLFRPQFDTLKLSDKLWLMQTLATRYNLTFKELYAFSRWGQSCTTGLIEKGGREFVFVPGDTVILGWESFVQGMDKDYYRQFRMGYDYYGLDQKTRVSFVSVLAESFAQSICF